MIILIKKKNLKEITLVDCGLKRHMLNVHRMEPIPMFYQVQLLHNGYWRSTFQGNLKDN